MVQIEDLQSPAAFEAATSRLHRVGASSTPGGGHLPRRASAHAASPSERSRVGKGWCCDGLRRSRRAGAECGAARRRQRSSCCRFAATAPLAV